MAQAREVEMHTTSLGAETSGTYSTALTLHKNANIHRTRSQEAEAEMRPTRSSGPKRLEQTPTSDEIVETGRDHQLQRNAIKIEVPRQASGR